MEHLKNEAAFGSEELRVALLAGGERSHHVKCPKCLSDDVRRTGPATLYESCMRLFVSPYRCRKCLSRFYGIGSARNSTPLRRLLRMLSDNFRKTCGIAVCRLAFSLRKKASLPGNVSG
jgi:transposase-like protein